MKSCPWARRRTGHSRRHGRVQLFRKEGLVSGRWTTPDDEALTRLYAHVALQLREVCVLPPGVDAWPVMTLKNGCRFSRYTPGEGSLVAWRQQYRSRRSGEGGSCTARHPG